MATTQTMIETATQRLVLIDPESRGVYAAGHNGGYHLPTVEIPQWTRPAEQLQRTVRDAWKTHSIMLDYLPSEETALSCVALEVIEPPEENGLKLIPLCQLSPAALPETQRNALQEMLDGNNDSRPRLSQIGWIEEAIAWCEAVTPQKLTAKTGITQYNAGGNFALLRLPMSDGVDYWIKATGKPNAHEYGITLLLSEVCEGFTPEVVAAKPEWNAWLMAGGGNKPIQLPDNPLQRYKTLERLMYSLLEMEWRAIEIIRALKLIGAPDQSLEAIAKNAEKLFDYLERAMSLQTSTKSPPLDRNRLRDLYNTLLRVRDLLMQEDLPISLIHGDLNLGNIVAGESSCQFIDWAEAYIGPVGINLEHLLLLDKSEAADLRQLIHSLLKERYIERWNHRSGNLRMSSWHSFWPFLAVLSSLYGRGDWFDDPQQDDPRRMSIRRSLARHLSRTAADPHFQEALCRE